jgi:hypothetical protein
MNAVTPGRGVDLTSEQTDYVHEISLHIPIAWRQRYICHVVDQLAPFGNTDAAVHAAVAHTLEMALFWSNHEAAQ